MVLTKIRMMPAAPLRLLPPLLLLLSCGIFKTTQAAPAFGTESGWDVGGTDPLCWVSKIFVDPSEATLDN